MKEIEPDPDGPYSHGLHTISAVDGIALIDAKRAEGRATATDRVRARLHKGLDSPVGRDPKLAPMSTLLTIGEFSRLTHLSVKALRHYDELGLLRPAEVDASSGYRRYATAQVPVAHVISRSTLHVNVAGGVESGLSLIPSDIVGIEVLTSSVRQFVEPPIRHTASLVNTLPHMGRVSYRAARRRSARRPVDIPRRWLQTIGEDRWFVRAKRADARRHRGDA